MKAQKAAVFFVLAAAFCWAAACDDAPSHSNSHTDSDIDGASQDHDGADSEVTADDTFDVADDDPGDIGDPEQDVDDGDGDEDDQEQAGPNPAWEQFENECAPKRTVVAPETRKSPDLADGLGEVPRLLWRKATLCPDDPRYAGPDTSTMRQDFAHGTFNIDGRLREVVAVINHGPRGDTIAPVAYSIALLDAQTGESLQCIDLPFEATNVEQRLRVVSGQGIFVPYVTRRGEAAQVSSIPDIFGLAAYRPDTGELFDRQIEIDGNSGHGDVRSVVTQNGQVIVNWKNRRLVSFDYETGDVYWTIGANAFDVQYENFSLRGPLFADEDTVIVKLYRFNHDTRFFQVDRCGQVTELTDALGANNFFHQGDTQVRVHDDRVVARTQDRVVEFSEKCEHLATISANQLACTVTDPSESVFLVKILNLATGEVNKTSITAPQAATYMNFDGLLIGGANNMLVTTANYLLNDSNSVRRFYFMDASTLEIEDEIDLELPDEHSSTFSSTTPMLLKDGKMIVGAWGSIFAVQTNIGGLANAPYPREIYLGGNENRGYLRPQESN